MQRADSGAYPPRYYRRIQDAQRRFAKILLATGLMFIGATGSCLIFNGALIIAAITGALFLFCCISAIVSYFDERVANVIPYFSKSAPRVEGPTTFMSGSAIARHCLTLDEMAEIASFVPLSHFGFADDIQGETLTWHKASDGLQSVCGLIALLRADDFPAAHQIIDELQLIAEKLREAEKADAPFCFLLWHGKGISLYEMDLRQGYI
jgi:hypothetical protein